LDHYAIDELLHQRIDVYRIGTSFSTFYRTFTWHLKFSAFSYQHSAIISRLSAPDLAEG
jgi:hypothetical protein